MQKMPERLKAFAQKHMRLIVDFIIILAVTIVVFRNWIFSPQWPAGGDILGYISREYLYWRDFRWLYVWRPNSFGYPEGIDLKDFFFMLLRFVAENAANTAKIFAILSFALAGYAMYALGYHCTKRHLPALAGSLVYLLNGQFLTQLTEAHLDIMFSYAVAPMIFLFLDRALETRKMKDIVVTSILFGVMLTGFSPEMVVIYGTFLGLFMIFNLLRPQKSLRYRESLKLRLKTLVIIGALAAILSACFLVPFLFNVKAPYLSGTFSRGNMEDAYSYAYKNFWEAFTLEGKENYGYVNVIDVTKGASLQILPVPTILMIVFAFAYVVTLVFKLNRYSFFFGLSALLSIIISMGPYSFESCFIWAWANVPYFDAFRAISRWGSMTALSNSFFVCVSTSILTSYILRTLHKPEKEFEVKMNLQNGMQEPRNVRVSLPSIDRVSHYTKRVLYYAAIFALVAILMSGFISTWFLFSRGLQTYTPPSDYFQPYNYLNNVPGDYKIVTVGRTGNDWYSTQGQSMDFVGGGMLTPIGWDHDLGYESTFIDDKATLQDGGLSTLSANFVDYLRFSLAANNITRNMLKLLGAFDYKYVVIPSYVTENLRAFFMSQYGGQLIYNQSNSLILENAFYTPTVFAPLQSALVVGGPESLFSLCGISSYDLSKTATILANQVNSFSDLVGNNLKNVSTVVFADTSISDMIMTPSDDVNLINLANYGIQSYNASAYWIKGDSWANTGAIALGGETLTTSGKNTIGIPVELKTEGDYDILIRAGVAPNRGKLVVSVDGLPISTIVPNSDFWSDLEWINLTSNYHLEAGSHLITLANDGSGYNDLDAIAIVEHSQLTQQTEETVNAFQGFTGKILYLIEAAKAFSKPLPNGWSILTIPGEGYGLHVTDGSGGTPQASTSIFIPRKGEYNFAVRLFPDTESNSFLYVKVDDKLFSVNSLASENETTWFELGSTSLDVGNHKITVYSSGNVALDQIGVYSATEKQPSIDDFFNSNLSAASISYEKLNPCKYVAHVSCTEPFLLVFSESYNPLWKAYVDNKEISPIIVDSLANGFFINRTGNFDVVLYFTGQDIVNIGLIISASGIGLIIAIALAESAVGRKTKRFLISHKPFKRSKADTQRELD